MTLIHQLLFWEVILACSFCNTCFERAFDCISGQVVCAIGKARVEKSAGFLEAKFCKLLQVCTIHNVTLC